MKTLTKSSDICHQPTGFSHYPDGTPGEVFIDRGKTGHDVRSTARAAAVWPPTAEVAREAGHRRQSPLRAIREKCIDCSGGSPAEARRCEATACPLWPFRAGRHPWLRSRGKPPFNTESFEQDEAIGGPTSARRNGGAL